MFGCGGDRDRTKRPLMGRVAARARRQGGRHLRQPASEDPLAIIEEILAGIVRRGATSRSSPIARRRSGGRSAEPATGDVVVIAGKGHEPGQTFAERTCRSPIGRRREDALRRLGTGAPA